MSLLLLAWAASTQTIPDPVEQDVHCLAAFAIAVGQAKEKPDQTQALQLSSILWYFQGRVDGRAPNLDLRTAMAAAFSRFKDKGLWRRELERCAIIAADRAEFLITFGESLLDKSEKQ